MRLNTSAQPGLATLIASRATTVAHPHSPMAARAKAGLRVFRAARPVAGRLIRRSPPGVVYPVPKVMNTWTWIVLPCWV